MSDKLKLDRFGVGDIVQTRRTHRIERVFKDGGLRIADVQTGTTFHVSPTADHGSLRVDLVLKAPKARPKPYPGAVLTGQEIRDTWWKRGTIIRCVESDQGTPARGLSSLVLQGDGEWLDLDSGWDYGFDDLAVTAKFELRFVA